MWSAHLAPLDGQQPHTPVPQGKGQLLLRQLGHVLGQGGQVLVLVIKVALQECRWQARYPQIQYEASWPTTQQSCRLAPLKGAPRPEKCFPLSALPATT